MVIFNSYVSLPEGTLKACLLSTAFRPLPWWIYQGHGTSTHQFFVCKKWTTRESAYKNPQNLQKPLQRRRKSCFEAHMKHHKGSVVCATWTERLCFPTPPGPVAPHIRWWYAGNFFATVWNLWCQWTVLNMFWTSIWEIHIIYIYYYIEILGYVHYFLFDS